MSDEASPGNGELLSVSARHMRHRLAMMWCSVVKTVLQFVPDVYDFLLCVQFIACVHGIEMVRTSSPTGMT
eukprot:1161438-Pelagomonas_calceolata.AAC.6